MGKRNIIGISGHPKHVSSAELQRVLTKFGCSIRTRLGLNEDDEESFLILLEITGTELEKQLLEQELIRISGVEVKSMIFGA